MTIRDGDGVGQERGACSSRSLCAMFDDGTGDGGVIRVDVLGPKARTGGAFKGGVLRRFFLAAMDMLLLLLCAGPWATAPHKIAM
eukprot:2733457-Pyramimonas_sp.AAC.1